MSGLIERLRYLAGTSSQQLDPNILLLKEAVDRIVELEAALERIALDTANNTNLESHYAAIARAALQRIKDD